MEVESDRLSIRWPEISDAWPLFQGYFSDVAASKFLGRAAHPNPEVTLRSIELWRSFRYDAQADMRVLSVVLKASQQPIGIMVLKREGTAIEIHFGLNRTYSGQGYATEMCRAMANALQASGYHKVWSYAHIEHAASLRVLEKAGFQPARRLRSWMVFPNLSNDKQDCLEMIYQADVPAQ
ncbi:TPA: N-acetyltransferase [Vibrio vulnificus]|nr:GNAT family N-acetyltransferase [Vibrio vulnificus]ELH3489484.1 GNAT family N-acetyltransferase [Vibrio vulnificus]HAS8614473.1 N-acetyltransferase [Vibrio vulnificus]